MDAYLTDLAEDLRLAHRGRNLLDPAGALIHTLPRLPESQATYEHPFADRLPDDAFVREGESVVVFADCDILAAFQRAGCEPPRFLVAGAHKRYRLHPARLNVGVLTAGGNAPGLDAIVDALVKRQFLLGTKYAEKLDLPRSPDGLPADLRFYGIVGGYKGLQELTSRQDSRWVIPLTPQLTDQWSNRACSSLHALRTPSVDGPAYDAQIDRLADHVRLLDLDILYTIGGNGTLKIADALSERLMRGGKPCIVVGGPKTMDNDINFTDVTFGFRTSVDNAVEEIRRIHREAETLERVAIVELFGAAGGFVALHAAYASGEVDYVLIPEMMGDTVGDAARELKRALDRISSRYRKRRHAVLVVAEGASIMTAGPIHRARRDLPLSQFAHGNRAALERAFADLVKYAQKTTGLAMFACQPRHLIRATPPNGFDLDLCKYTGKLMVDTALAGYTGCSVHLWQGDYVLVPLALAVSDLKRVNMSGYYFMTLWEKYFLD